MSAMEWLWKLLGDLDADERRRLLVVLRAALSFGDDDQQAGVWLLKEEVERWALLEARDLVVLMRFAEPRQRDFVDPRYYAAEVWLSDDGARAVVSLVAQALGRLDMLLS